MSRTARYAFTGLLVCLFGSALVWPWLDDAGRLGLLAAAVVAWTVQVVAFGALVRFRGTTKGFLAAWVGGTAVRMVLVLLAAWMVVAYPVFPPAPTLLGLAGFFFGLLLLEPVYYGTDASLRSGGDARTLDTATMDTA